MRDGVRRARRGVQLVELLLRRLEPLRRGLFPMRAEAEAGELRAGVIEQRLDQTRRKFPASDTNSSTWRRSQPISGMA